MPEPTEPNTEINSILENNPDYQLESSDKPTNPIFSLIEAPPAKEKGEYNPTPFFNNEYWKEIYGRINFRAAIEKYKTTVTKSEDPAEITFAQDTLLDFFQTTINIKKFSEFSPLDFFDRENLETYEAYRNRSIETELDEQGLLYSDNAQYNLRNENKPFNPELAEKADDILKEADELLEQFYFGQYWMHSSAEINLTSAPYLHSFRDFLRKIKDSGGFENLENAEMVKLGIQLFPIIKKKLYSSGAIPDPKNESERIKRRVERFKNVDPELVKADIIHKNVPDNQIPFMAEDEINDLLISTIPAGFISGIRQIILNGQKPELIIEVVDDKNILVEISGQADNVPYKTVVEIFSSFYDPEKETAPVETKKITLVHDVIHGIYAQLGFTEAFEWNQIYSDEIEGSQITNRMLARYKAKGAFLPDEAFARMYSLYMFYPNIAERTFPKSAKYIRDFIERYSSNAQAGIMESFHLSSKAADESNPKSKSEKSSLNNFW